MNSLSILDDVAPLSNRLVRLNLRGTEFIVPATCADRIPESRLAKVLRGSLPASHVILHAPAAAPGPADDTVHPSSILTSPPTHALYFNRNPTVFHMVLDVACNGYAMPPFDHYTRELFEEEMRYWGVTSKRLRDAQDTTAVPLQARQFGKLEIVSSSSSQAPASLDTPFGAPPAIPLEFTVAGAIVQERSNDADAGRRGIGFKPTLH